MADEWTLLAPNPAMTSCERSSKKVVKDNAVSSNTDLVNLCVTANCTTGLYVQF